MRSFPLSGVDYRYRQVTKSRGELPADIQFRSESELVRVFSGLVRKESKIGHTCEFDSSYGIADLVVFRPAADWKHLVTVLAKLPAGTAYAVRLLPYKKSFELNEFCALTASSSKHARTILERIRVAGFVRRLKTGDGWIKLRQPRPVVKELIAIEAKVRDWSRALHQASRYRHFANASWVLMDQSHTRPALRNLEAFRKSGVGLASINCRNRVTVYQEARVAEPRSAPLYWLANVRLAEMMSISRGCLHIPRLPQAMG